MIVCPVCEHPQAQGVECDVCGKRLVQGAAAIALAAVPSVEGLEPTLHAAAAAVRSEPVADVEPTLHAPAAAGGEDRVPDVEPTRAAPVDVEVQPALDLERTSAAIPGDAPTAVPAIVACRYCRTPAMPGERVCSRCGMRLPVWGTRQEAPAAHVRRCSCGAPVRGALCPSCGARRGEP